MFNSAGLIRRDVSSSTAFWNTSTAFAQSQANVSFTYQVGVRWHIYSKKELAGVAITALAGLLSMVTLVALLLFILYTWVLKSHLITLSARRDAIKSRRLNASFLPFSPRSGTFDSSLEDQTTRPPKNAFWKTQTSKLLICLFLSDLIQSISGVIQLHWIDNGRIEDNTACKMQGAFLHLGDVATAIWSAGIAFLTFANIVLRANLRDWMIVAFIIFGWTLAVILNVIGPIAYTVSEEWFGIAGGWCFITSSFLLPRIFLHYVPMFLAAFIILFSYSLVALHLRGILTYDERGRFRWDWSWNQTSSTQLTSSYAKSMSWKMMWYPLAYMVLILPDSSNRLAALMGRTSPDGFWYAGMAMLFSMGWVNVLIYCTTRNVLGIKRSKNAKGVVVSNGGSSKMTTDSVISPKFCLPTPLPMAASPTTMSLLASPVMSYTPPPPPITEPPKSEHQEAKDGSKEDQTSSPTGTSTPLLKLPAYGTWDEFKGTPFQNPFTVPSSSIKSSFRSATSMIGPLTPISQIGLAITTPRGMMPNLPQASTSSLSVNYLPNRSELPVSDPETPSSYSCETEAHSAVPPLSAKPPSSEDDVGLSPSPKASSGDGHRRVTPSVPVSLHTLSETSSLHPSTNVPSPSLPSSLSGKNRRDPDRKMSLYPMSVKSTDTDFEFGKTEFDTGSDRFPYEGWIPIKI